MIWLRYWPVVAVFAGLYAFSSAWLAIGLYHAGIVAAWIWRVRQGETTTRRRALMTARWLTVVLGLGTMAGTLLAVAALLPVVLGEAATETSRHLAAALVRSGLEGTGWWAFVLYFVTVHPVLEEIAWRDFLLEKRKGWHLSDAEFALYHLPVLWFLFPGEVLLLGLAFASLNLAGWAWRQMAWRAGGLRLAVVTHLGADAGIMGAVIWLLAGC